MDINFSFNASVKKHPDVLLKQVGETCVLLNLKTESYYGLDAVGYDFYQQLVASPSIEAAFTALTEQYEIEASSLRADLEQLIGELLQAEVISVEDPTQSR